MVGSTKDNNLPPSNKSLFEHNINSVVKFDASTYELSIEKVEYSKAKVDYMAPAEKIILVRI